MKRITALVLFWLSLIRFSWKLIQVIVLVVIDNNNNNIKLSSYIRNDDVHHYTTKTTDRLLFDGVRTQHQEQRRLKEQIIDDNFSDTSSSTNSRKKERVLYIVTSIAEFDNGKRATTKGYDRFTNTLIPVLYEGIKSMNEVYNIDIVLITHYKITKHRYEQIKDVIPNNVGLQIWDEATPLMYELENDPERIVTHSRGLSRQHRYIIKDKFFYYDIFVCFEDDMLIKKYHIEQYIHITNQLYKTRKVAPENIQQTLQESHNNFYGLMTKNQLARTIPGFIRVEAALPGFQQLKRNKFRQIPLNKYWNNIETNINSSICCHISEQYINEHIPYKPSSNDLYFWETNIQVLGVRQMPYNNNNNNNTWVTLLGGNNNEIWDDPNYVIGDYWSGRDHANEYYKDQPNRPDRKDGRYISNQGGWMATRRQIVEWHIRWCRGGFLPPYNTPYYRYDGLDLRPVEYWSGGIQLVGVNACNQQRIVSLEPTEFAKQLLYHTSNNKQRAKKVKPQFSGRNINEFWSQLNTIKNNAEITMSNEKKGGKMK